MECSPFADLITHYIPQSEEAKSEDLYLYVDLPRFDFPVIFNERVRDYPSIFVLYSEVSQETSLPIHPFTTNPPNATQPPPQPVVNINTDPHLWQILDPDMMLENPVEDKHRRLVRSHRSGPLDREMKPNAAIRDDLNVSPQTCMDLRTYFDLDLGHPQLRAYPNPTIRGEGPNLEIPILPHS